MIPTMLVAVFTVVVATGPAGREWRERRRARRDAPMARVEYLPSRACRESNLTDD